MSRGPRATVDFSQFLQALVLWAIIALTQCGVHGAPATGCVGGLLVAVAVFTGLEGPRLR